MKTEVIVTISRHFRIIKFFFIVFMSYVTSFILLLANVKPHTDKVTGMTFCPYFYEDKRYILCIPPRRNSIVTLSITDLGGRDVSEKVLWYAGPNKDFFGQKVTPLDIGIQTLITVEAIVNGKQNTRTIAADSPISFSGV